jgi:hypothetical protein
MYNEIKSDRHVILDIYYKTSVRFPLISGLVLALSGLILRVCACMYVCMYVCSCILLQCYFIKYIMNIHNSLNSHLEVDIHIVQIDTKYGLMTIRIYLKMCVMK